MTCKKGNNIYNDMKTFLLFPVPSSIVLSQWLYFHFLTLRRHSSATAISMVHNVHLAWFLCTWILPSMPTHKSSTSPLQGWGLNACSCMGCVVVYIYRYLFWLNSRLLSVLTEHEESSVSHLAHYLLCGKFICAH